MIPFITSKYGKIHGLKIYQYKYSDELMKQPKMLQGFKNWLKYNDDITVTFINDNQFSTLLPLKEGDNWQYNLFKERELVPPIKNTQLVSLHLANLVNESFSKHYNRFFKNNEYVFKKVDLFPFKLHKCIGFSVEVFEQATFHINFCPQTRITSSNLLTEKYIDQLRLQYPNDSENAYFTVVELGRLRRIQIDLLSEKAVTRLKEHIKEGKQFVATFDYSFVSSYSKELFYKLISNTRKDVDDNIFVLQEVLESIELDNALNVQSKPFYKIDVLAFGLEKNLRIGSGKVVNKQSAAHYNGVYQPAKNCIIQPILVDVDFPKMFNELLEEFNGNQNNVNVLEPIVFDLKKLNYNSLIELKKSSTDINFLCPIFSLGMVPQDVLEVLKENRIYYQLYSGNPQRAKLANFTVRCIEKLGGLLSVIDNSEVDERTYFIGIDLGHDRIEKTTNIAFSYFDFQGRLVHKSVTEGLSLNEAITSEIWQNLDSFRGLYKSGKIAAPERIIVHRDGRIHDGEIELLVDHIQRHFDVYEIDVIEVIKSGFPVIAGFEDGAYVNLNSGDAYIDNENKYSILITNTQSSLTNSLVKPIIIKHKYGDLKMETLVKQVYWFTRIYTNNLYRATRLPATTLKANNIVGTGSSKHYPTYLG